MGINNIVYGDFYCRKGFSGVVHPGKAGPKKTRYSKMILHLSYRNSDSSRASTKGCIYHRDEFPNTSAKNQLLANMYCTQSDVVVNCDMGLVSPVLREWWKQNEQLVPGAISCSLGHLPRVYSYLPGFFSSLCRFSLTVTNKRQSSSDKLEIS